MRVLELLNFDSRQWYSDWKELLEVELEVVDFDGIFFYYTDSVSRAIAKAEQIKVEHPVHMSKVSLRREGAHTQNIYLLSNSVVPQNILDYLEHRINGEYSYAAIVYEWNGVGAPIQIDSTSDFYCPDFDAEDADIILGSFDDSQPISGFILNGIHQDSTRQVFKQLGLTEYKWKIEHTLKELV